VIHHGLQARENRLPTDFWIEGDSCRVQFVHDWWSTTGGCMALSALMPLTSPPLPQSHPNEGGPSQVATMSGSNSTEPTVAPKAPNSASLATDDRAIKVLGSGGDDDSNSPTRGVKYLQQVLNQVQHGSSTSHNSRKSTPAPHGKANTYSSMCSSHHNKLLNILDIYVNNVMEYCNGENINPHDAFQYLHGKLPVKGLTAWQAFCQLRGLLRARAFGTSHTLK
jgi:hypothetical protein